MAKRTAFILLSFFLFSPSLYAALDISYYQDFIQWILSQQADFHHKLVTLVRAISKEGSTTLLWGLLVTSFFYGIFHAAGPGHGKAVISAYMLASKAPLRRGISLSFLCAGAQGVMAILVIVVLSQMFSLAGKAMQVSRFLEVASFAGVGLIGVWMFIRLLQGKASCGHDHSQDHLNSSYSEHSHSCNHDHSGAHASCCSHEHEEKESSDVNEIKAGRRSIWAMALAVGIRPCTGAVLVLLFSLSTGIFEWGLAATFAMSLGTAITVASLASISVFIRDTGFVLSREHQVWRKRLSKIFGFIAAFALIIISGSMIWSYISNAGRAF